MRVKNRLIKVSKICGFTLIELIAGIVIMAIAMTSLVSFLNPQATNSIDPIYQVRAAELGQSLMNEIMGKAFDENSNLSGGLLRCSEALATPCSAASDFGPNQDPFESNDVDTFDDVDDYHGYTPELLGSSDTLATLYQDYTVSVSVVYDGDYNGVADTPADHHAKLILITVKTPNNDAFEFAAYRGNY